LDKSVKEGDMLLKKLAAQANALKGLSGDRKKQ
jgi:hypothetical protein